MPAIRLQWSSTIDVMENRAICGSCLSVVKGTRYSVVACSASDTFDCSRPACWSDGRVHHVSNPVGDPDAHATDHRTPDREAPPNTGGEPSINAATTKEPVAQTDLPLRPGARRRRPVSVVKYSYLPIRGGGGRSHSHDLPGRSDSVHDLPVHRRHRILRQCTGGRWAGAVPTDKPGRRAHRAGNDAASTAHRRSVHHLSEDGAPAR